jgi:hypothetical protein
MKLHPFLTTIGTIVIFGKLFIACQEDSPTISPEKVNPVVTVKATIDSLDISFLRANASWNRMPGSRDSAMIYLNLLVRNKAIVGTLDGALVGIATVFNSTGTSALFTYKFDYVCGTDALDWNGKMKPGQKDTIWCPYRFYAWGVPIRCNDTIFVRFNFSDLHGNFRSVDSPLMEYMCPM